MLLTVIGALLPVIVTLLMGVVAAWHHDFDAKQATVLNRMVMLYALPMLLFAGMLAVPRHQLMGDASLAAVIMIAMIMGFFVPLLVARFLCGRDLMICILRTAGAGDRSAVGRLCRFPGARLSVRPPRCHDPRRGQRRGSERRADSRLHDLAFGRRRAKGPCK